MGGETAEVLQRDFVCEVAKEQKATKIQRNHEDLWMEYKEWNAHGGAHKTQ